MPNQTTETVAAALINTIFLEHWVLEVNISDRKTNLRSELIAELCKQLRVKLTTLVDGMTKKYNGVIINRVLNLLPSISIGGDRLS